MEHFEALAHFYENEGDERQRLSSGSIQHLEFLTGTKYIDKVLPQNARVLDSCAGSGAYAFYLAQKGHVVTAGDIVPHNVRLLAAQQAKTPLLAAVETMDAQDLSRYEDACFDAVLCMGALYHLHGADERQKAVSEALRVLRPGGVLVCSYMNRYAVVMNNIEPEFANLQDALQFAKTGIEGIYYAGTAPGMAALMEENGLAKLWHVPLDGMAYFLVCTTGVLNTPAAFENWKQYHFAVCEDESMLGGSYHNLYIGRRG